MPPLHDHPVNTGDADVDAVGIIVGANDVGDADVPAVGARVGDAVGFEGQLVMPSLKLHSALASIRCCSEG